MNNLVSVIIPTYSRPYFLPRAIESVLCQTYSPIEIIVVDDNGIGTDYQIETERLLSDYILSNKISYLKHDKNKNGSAARNTGFRYSKGDYIVFHDDDDVMHPDKVKKQIEAIQRDNSGLTKASYCNCVTMKNERIIKRKEAIKSGFLLKDFLMGKWGFGSGSNLMVTREVVEELGGYDESFLRHQDYEFVGRLLRLYKIAAINEDLLVKYEDGKNRIPNIERLIDIEERYLGLFVEDIAKFSKAEQQEVYYSRWFALAMTAANIGEYDKMNTLLKTAFGYKKPSIRDLARIIKNMVFKPYARRA